jgi:hypothetical protein
MFDILVKFSHLEEISDNLVMGIYENLNNFK